MRKKKNKRVVLNHRDRELFNYLYQVKVATAKQIRRDVFDDVSLTVIYRRLKKLIRKKYIQRIPFFDGKKNISAFSLSKTGFKNSSSTNTDGTPTFPTDAFQVRSNMTLS